MSMNNVVGIANPKPDSGNSPDKGLMLFSQQANLVGSFPSGPDEQHFAAGYIRITNDWMRDVWQLQEETRRNQSNWTSAFVQLADNVFLIQEQMKSVTAFMEKLAAQRTFVVPLTTLESSEPLQMKLNIPATIDGDGQDFTASFTEANVSASGETEADAIANLKESLIETFEFLESIPENERGPLPSRQWEILSNVLAR